MAGLERTQLEQYFLDLGMGAPLVSRGLSVVDTIERLLPEPVTRVFVTEYRDEEGIRHYENLWLFTDRLLSEAHNYLTEDNFDVVPIHPGLIRIEVDRDNFDFSTPAEHSRLSVEIAFPPSRSIGISGSFRASGDNCLVLTEILQQRLLPMLGGG